jgi:pilus assembly protein CpaC
MRREHRVSLLLAALLLAVPRGSSAQSKSERTDAEVPHDNENITLAIGETKVISARDVKNYSEGSAGVIDLKLTTDASAFVINGKRQGSTTLLLIKNDGSQLTLNIDVFARSPQAVEHELQQLLSGLSGVRVVRVGAHIVLDGTVADEAEKARVAHVASLYPGQVDSLVTVVAGGGVAAPVAPNQPRFLVRIDFYFVQYDADSTYALGIGWPASIGGASIASTFQYNFLTGAPIGATATLSNQPLPRLDIASITGWAKVMRQATVIASNGTEASFSNGGEQNFTITTGLGVGVQKIPFGTDITVLPKYDPQSRQIDLKLTADVADLTAAVSGTPLPGRTTSKLVTNVSLKLGQSLVLSGIRRESTTHTISGIPLLKDIPVIGLLFGSHQNDSQQTEAAVFIVPSVIEPISTPAQELVDTAFAKFRDYSGGIDKVHSYDRRPPVPAN